MTSAALLLFAATAGAISIDQVTSPTKNNSQTVTGTIDPGAVVSVQCSGATAGAVSNPTETSWSVLITGLGEGSNSVTASATVGDPSSAIAVIVVDTVAPTLTVSSLANGTITNNPTLNVSGVAKDGAGSGVTGVTVNGNSTMPAADGNFSYVLSLSAGANSVTTVATDAAGNSVQDTRVVTLDQSAPQIIISSPADNIATSQSPVTVTGTVDENALVVFSVNTGSPQAAMMNGANFTADAYLANGLNTITVTATDLASNSSTAKRTVTYDTTKPTLQIQDPSQDIVTKQSSYTIKGTVSDTLSAVTVTVAVDGVTSTPPVIDGDFQHLVTFIANKSYHITATATDAAGNVTAVTRNIIFDSSLPAISGASSTTAAGHYGAGRSINVTLAFSEPVTSTGLTILLSSGATITSGPFSGVNSYSGTYVVADGHNAALLNVTSISGTLADSVGNLSTNPSVPDGNNIGNAVAISVDTTAPIATIGSKPTDPTNIQTGSFSFSIDEPGSSDCRIDNAPYSVCVSPYTFSSLKAGSHTFSVRGTDPAGNTGAAASYSWTIDTTAPAATISGTPASPTNSTGATLTVGGTDAVSYRYKLDTGDFAAETATTSPVVLSALIEGSHTVSVIAKDSAGNWQNTNAATSVSWTVDTTAPITTIATKPAPLVNTSTGSFSFTANESGSVFECKLDTGSYAACTSPFRFSSLADGSHVFSVEARDPAGNTGAAASYSWTIDTSATVATIGGTPASPTNSTGATLTVGGTDAVSYRYKFDTGNYAAETAATSPVVLSGLIEGSHTVSVIAKDSAGNWQLTNAATSVSWTVDTTAPITTIATKPVPLVNSSTGSFSFTANESGSVFECKLDTGSYAACTSPSVHQSLADGSHTFSVRGKDLAGNTGTAASYSWTIDTSATVATISGTPANPTNSTGATLTVGGTDAVSYRYKLDAGDFAAETATTSPIVLSGLIEGSHTVSVIAKDSAGNWQLTNVATSVSWTVDTTAPITTIATKPAPLVNSSTGSFSFTANESGSVFDCKLDIGSYAACTSPSVHQSLADGSHTFSVRGKDLAGNTGTAASYSWTIDTSVTVATIGGTPASPTNSTGATLTVGGTDAVSYRYKLDTGDYAAETAATSPVVLSGLIEGPHTVSVIAKDSAGNWQNSDAPTSVSWTVDISAPDTLLGAHPSAFSPASSGSIAFSSPDTTARFECSLDNASYAACTSPFGCPALFDGSHSFLVLARDLAGNVDQTPVSYVWTVDTTAPVVSAGQNQTRNATFTHSGTVSDATALTYLWTKQSGPGDITFGSPTAVVTTISAGAEGIYVLRLTATDAAGNSSFDEMTLTWDTTAPSVNAGGNKTANAVFTQTATASDATALKYRWTQQSGPGTITFGSPLALVTTITSSADGSYVLRLAATDDAGNSAFTDMTLAWDTVKPFVSAGAGSAHNATYTQAASASDPLGMTFSWSCTSGPGAIVFGSPGTISTTVTADREGVYTLAITAIDAAGNNSSSEATLTWDLTAPTLSIATLPNNAYTNEATLAISGAVTDTLSGVQRFTINGADIPLDDLGAFNHSVALSVGANVITMTASDRAGNRPYDVRTIMYDPAAPNVTISSPGSDYKTNLPRVTVTGTVDKECSVAIHVSGGGLEQSFSNVPVSGNIFTLPIDGLAVGRNTIDITAISSANLRSTKSVTVTYDNEKPLLDVTSPAGDVRSTQGSIVISGTTSDSQTGVSVTIIKDLETYRPQVVNGSFSQTIPLAEKKVYIIAVRASDDAGNESIVKRRVIFETSNGDINGDGHVDIADALLALQVSVGMTPQLDSYLVKGDVGPLKNGLPEPDWKIDIGDVVLILRTIVGSLIL